MILRVIRFSDNNQGNFQQISKNESIKQYTQASKTWKGLKLKNNKLF